MNIIKTFLFPLPPPHIPLLPLIFLSSLLSQLPSLSLSYRFFFPANFTYNDSTVPTNDWAVMISSITVQRWANINGDDEPPQQAPDDDNNENEFVSNRCLLTRLNYTRLHQRFLVPDTNSYACSGSMMNTYTKTLYNVDNGTLKILGFDSNYTDAHGLNLTSLQVVTYNTIVINIV